jgi:hypothetical protein
MPVEVAVGEGYRGASGEHLFVGNCSYCGALVDDRKADYPNPGTLDPTT